MRDGWVIKQLDQVCTQFGAGPFGSNMKVSTFVDAGIPVVSGNHMTELELVEESFNYITEVHANRMQSSIVQRNDVVITKAGTIGQVSLIPENSRFLKYVLSSRQLFARPNVEYVVPRYLAIYLKYGRGQDQILSNVNRTGVPSLSQAVSFIKNVRIELPPLPEQKRIVDLISSVDSYIEALEQQLGSVRSASNAHLEKIVSAFSDDWREITLGEVLEISRGGSPRPIQEYLTDSEDGINWVKIADATRSEKYIYSTLQKIKREGISRSREVFSGDFVLSNSMSFGRPYIMRTDGCIHDGWLLLSKVSNNFDEDFLYNLLNSDYVQRQFESLAAGSGVRNLNIEVVKKVKVKIPTIEVQKELASVINEFDNFIIKLTKQIHSGLDLRQALLSDLLSGAHEIPASYDKIMGAA